MIDLGQGGNLGVCVGLGFVPCVLYATAFFFWHVRLIFAQCCLPFLFATLWSRLPVPRAG